MGYPQRGISSHTHPLRPDPSAPQSPQTPPATISLASRRQVEPRLLSSPAKKQRRLLLFVPDAQSPGSPSRAPSASVRSAARTRQSIKLQLQSLPAPGSPPSVSSPRELWAPSRSYLAAAFSARPAVRSYFGNASRVFSRAPAR